MSPFFAAKLGQEAIDVGLQVGMRRRAVLAAFASMTAAHRVCAQPAGKIPTIGYLGSNSREAQARWTAAFVRRLGELGWIEGRTVVIEWRFADGQFDRAPALVADFVAKKVDLIVTSAEPNIRAAMQATSTIPIVFAVAGDPVGGGLVQSLARPGGNVTGLSAQSLETAAKRLQLMREAIPGLRRLAVPNTVGQTTSSREAVELAGVARSLGLELIEQTLVRTEEIAPFMASLKGRADALHVPFAPFFNSNRVALNRGALDAGIASFCVSREFMEGGALMSYGPDIADFFRRAADFADRILRGARPAEMPVEQTVRWELVISMGVAQTLGLALSPRLLAQADEIVD